MTEVKFRRSRAHLYTAFAFVCLIAIPLPLVAGWDIMVWGTDRQLVQYDTFGTAIFMGALLLGFGGLLLWVLLNLLSVKFTPEGVGQRGFAGWKFIPWRDVTDVRQVEHALHVYGGGRKVIIPSWAYDDWDEVTQFIAGHLPPRLTRGRERSHLT